MLTFSTTTGYRVPELGDQDMQIADIDGERTVELDARNQHNPDSVFLIGNGFTYEFDRAVLLRCFLMEIGMWEPISEQADRYLEALTNR